MADRSVTPGTWEQVVDGYLHAITATPPDERGAVELVAEAVTTADAALVEIARRDRDSFGWPAGAALACGAAVGCYQEAADWPVFDLPLPALVGYGQIPTAELSTGARRLIAAAHDATLALAHAAAGQRAALQLADAAGALIRPLLTFPSS
jgi:hypothetical protein